MPQIWLTYDEAGDLFGCDAATARERAIASGYDRKKSRDGQTRIKLSLSAAHDYMVAYAQGLANPLAAGQAVTSATHHAHSHALS